MVSFAKIGYHYFVAIPSNVSVLLQSCTEHGTSAQYILHSRICLVSDMTIVCIQVPVLVSAVIRSAISGALLLIIRLFFDRTSSWGYSVIAY